MKIPRFVEDRVVAYLDEARVKVNVADVIVRGGVTEKDTGEVVTVQFGPALSGTFDTHAGPEHFQIAKVRFGAIPSFVRCASSSFMEASIVEVNGVEEGSRPKCCR